MGLPASDNSTQDFSCPVASNPSIPNWYGHSYLSAAQPTEVWSGPLAGNFYRYPGSGYNSGYQPSVRGISFQGAFGGKVISSSDTTWNYVDQTVFYHQNACYAGGAEFGFFRLLQHPWSVQEETTVNFYWSLNTNCAGGTVSLPLYSSQGYETSPSFSSSGCSDAYGNPVIAQVNQTPIPLWVNSQYSLVYNYSAYLTTQCSDGTNTYYGPYFQVAIQDPYSGAYAYRGCIAANGYQAADGYVTMTIQKGLANDIFHNPLGDLQSTYSDWAAVGINQLQIAQQ
jgi:hypothetical protein